MTTISVAVRQNPERWRRPASPAKGSSRFGRPVDMDQGSYRTPRGK
jgi:hypothetical protein